MNNSNCSNYNSSCNSDKSNSNCNNNIDSNRNSKSNSKSNSNSGSNSNSKSISNEFRTVFKYYKQKVPPPSLECVIDPSNLQHQHVHFDTRPAAVKPQLSCRAQPMADWKIFSSKLNPGFHIVQGVLSLADQLYWAHRCLRHYSCSDNKRNIDINREITDWYSQSLEERKRSQEITNKLRWSTLGYHHNWETKEYSEESRGIFPPELGDLSADIAAGLGYSRFLAEAAIVNYYPLSSTLSGHTDHSEQNLLAPLLSISLGRPAIFLLGGPTTSQKPTPYLLSSGDVAVMEKEARLCYHAVPRILSPRDVISGPRDATSKSVNVTASPSDIPPSANDVISDVQTVTYGPRDANSQRCDVTSGGGEPQLEFCREYLLHHRININIRQVH